jgi:hypothetical protein
MEFFSLDRSRSYFMEELWPCTVQQTAVGEMRKTNNENHRNYRHHLTQDYKRKHVSRDIIHSSAVLFCSFLIPQR